MMTMRIKQMLSKVQQAGGEFGLLDGQPFVRGRAGTLTRDEIHFLKSSRRELARLLAPDASDNAANEANGRKTLSDANAASYPFAWCRQTPTESWYEFSLMAGVSAMLTQTCT